MDRWQAMKIFVKVAETESFAAAARQLHISAPVVTRAIAALEEVIGTRLFIRTTRTVKLTEPGLQYLNDCRTILTSIEEAEAAAAGSYATPSGILSVTASVLFGQKFVLPVITDYLDAWPTMRARSLFVDRQVNIIEEGIDVAVRIGHLPDSGLTATKVGTVRRVVCASPGYLEKYGTPITPADLKNHRIASSASAWASPEWRFAGEQRVMINAALQCNNNESSIATAKAGWGLTRVLDYQIASALRDGTLQIVLSDYELEPLPIHVVHTEGRHVSAKVRTFVDLIVARLRANPLLN
ncbi:LysR family transcriptional regulator [Klebsiella sp. Ap-873]|uniref:LysR family transcriptional regulator n=1 Tax=Cedecea neteri TaxID=158822 RepID=A0AAN0S1Z0_9ENTR|nr:LysR family transcriptional regulator [Cedecea neteri]AIR59777.1 LysR family transcriptional regulator [Cedecea neteri]NIG79336.1 LysR family transcriptional regulator [Klebsiella sp. Ap-873]